MSTSFATFGLSTVGAFVLNPNGVMNATKAIAKVDGELWSVALYLKAPSSYNARVALYANNAGVPGALIAQSAEVTVTVEQWYGFKMPGIKISRNTTYWLAVLANVNNTVLQINTGVSGDGYTKAQAYGAFPDPFGSGAATSNIVSQYALFNEDKPPAR